MTVIKRTGYRDNGQPADATIGVLGATRVAEGALDVVAGPATVPDQAFCWEAKAVRADVESLAVETDKVPLSIPFLEAI
ncbi:hypothetical protein [Micromonospora sp. NPDC005299]|uniref:hypothetical protein n=1 Tax=Micromonospora sp. NPDC005299 TaxID=3364231 RepID=UPI0036CEDBE2